MIKIHNKRKVAITLIILLPIISLGLAIGMYYNNLWTGTARTQKGELIWPAIPLSSLSLYDTSNQPFNALSLNKKWGLLIIGNIAGNQSDALDIFHITERLRVALNKDRDRLNRYVLLDDSAMSLIDNIPKGIDLITILNMNKDKFYHVIKKALPNYPDIEKLTLFLIDPLGNIMMAYTDKKPGQYILKDLQKLFRLSKIG